MTQKQATKELEHLRKEKCNCCQECVEIAGHKAGCPYRVAAFIDPDLREFVGPLYAVA